MSVGTKEAKNGPLEMIIPPFGFQATHPRMCDMLIQSIPGCRLRSGLDGTKGVMDADGDIRVPQDQARHLASCPRVPGHILMIDPANLSYEIIDPLHGDEKLCTRLERYLREESGLRKSDKIVGVPPKKGTLDVHRMKTLCREAFNIVASGEGTWVKGATPSMDDIDELPGRYLLNPGSVVGNTQPRYEDMFEHWVENLSRTGG